MAVHVHRRETSWPVLISLTLHLTLLLTVLTIAPIRIPVSEPEPLTVELVVGEAPAEAASLPPVPTAAPAPEVAQPPLVQQAEMAPPTPEVPPPPAGSAG